jgi:hypothetical protein
LRRQLPPLLFSIARAATTGVSAGACSTSVKRDAGTADSATEDAGTLDAEAGMTDADARLSEADVRMSDADALDGEMPDAEMHDEGTADGTGDDAICAQGCQLGTDVCGADYGTCAVMCRQSFGSGVCLPERRAAQNCVIAAGKDGIMCVNGQTHVKAGYCETEIGTLTTCLLGAPVDASGD